MPMYPRLVSTQLYVTGGANGGSNPLIGANYDNNNKNYERGIMSVSNYPFYTWFITTCLCLTGAFWTYKTGIFSLIYSADITGISLLITIFLPLFILWMGSVAYKIQYDHFYPGSSFFPDIDIAWFGKGMAIHLGITGTAIGLIHMLSTLIISANTGGTVDILPLLSKMSQGMGIALWTTCVGLVASAVIWLQAFLIERSYSIKFPHES